MSLPLSRLVKTSRASLYVLAKDDANATNKGLNLEELAKLFYASEPIRCYPPEKLNVGGFLLDLKTKREQTAYISQTLCWKNEKGKLIKA